MVLQEQVKATERIQIIYDTVVDEIIGDDKVEAIHIRNNKTNDEKDIPVDGVFIAVGNVPNTASIQGLPKQDQVGYIIADETCVTSIPGVYAAGDVRTKQLRQVITATADGANAITSIEKYLN